MKENDRFDTTAGYDADWFRIKAREHKEWYAGFAKAIYECFMPKSVADAGCGTGAILTSMHERGVTIRGWDGSANCLTVLPEQIKPFVTVHDFQDGYPEVEQKYDLAMCMEVAEHIPNECSEGLVKFLTELSDTIYFTAAPPGQGGRHHINEQPYEFWVNFFTKYNYELDVPTTKDLIKLMHEYSDGAFWVIKNSLVFRRKH